jgi:hypothetical protein
LRQGDAFMDLSWIEGLHIGAHQAHRRLAGDRSFGPARDHRPVLFASSREIDGVTEEIDLFADAPEVQGRESGFGIVAGRQRAVEGDGFADPAGGDRR